MIEVGAKFKAEVKLYKTALCCFVSMLDSARCLKWMSSTNKARDKATKVRYG